MAYRLADLGADSMPALLPSGAGGDWADLRRETERTWRHYLGGLPDSRPVRYTIVAEVAEASHVRRHLVYEAPGGERVPALLLVPRDAMAGRERAPAVLALHPTVDTGKADVATPEGRPDRRYGLELVERGYVVLAPDTITAGERVHEGESPFHTAGFYARNPSWTAVGRMLVDHRQAVDLLCALDVVDPDRIGAIGHSLGGYNGIFLAGLDERVRAVVASCGFSVFADDPEPNRWGERDWFSHLPALSRDIAVGEVPFEWHEIAALVAPRPLFSWSTRQDEIFPHYPAIAAGMAEVAKLYRALGHPERFEFLPGEGGHTFPGYARQSGYAFLDRWLR